jgi:hypothetical protein
VLVADFSHIGLMWTMANHHGEIPRRLVSIRRLIVLDRRRPPDGRALDDSASVPSQPAGPFLALRVLAEPAAEKALAEIV